MKRSFLKTDVPYWLSTAMFFFLAVTACFFLVFNFEFLDQFPVSSASTKADAIAVRILSNPNHYSPSRWYKEQGFEGNPQELTVDGYRAVRSGRTTYVNVGNVEGEEFNTYIYLMSYDQNAEVATKEIYRRMLDNWTFNTNLGMSGECSISGIVCSEDADCPEDYTCQEDGDQEDKCLPEDIPACQADDNCPEGLYCDSEKAKVVRDTIRWGDLSEIKYLLEEYKRNKGDYPSLEAGTYLRGKTVSVWPSWQEEFSRKLGTSLPKPSINVLGCCNLESADTDYQFDPRTCWDDNKKWFADPTPDNDFFNAPENSYAYIYKKIDDGYNLCAFTEYVQEGSGNSSCDSGGSKFIKISP